eukprot:PITA_35382
MTPDRYRPIALCNVVYKIISKVIANRLKPLLPTLMSKEQTRYVEGRQILNNIIQAHEVVHSLKRNKQAEVSLTKSKIFFFNTDIAIQRNLSRILDFQRDQLPSKYLGIPLTEKPLNKKIWEQVTNKLQDKIRKWTSRSLNLAGWLVLTKAILQTIPIFMFSSLPAPKGVFTTYQEHPKRFSLCQRGRRKEMGSGSLGKALQTQDPWRFGTS